MGWLGPIVEELYFRGYLLPRMEWMGRWAPLVNVSLFSLYHFWSPWQMLGRILALAPTVYAVRWKENIYLGMVVHCTLNTLGIVLVGSQVLAASEPKTHLTLVERPPQIGRPAGAASPRVALSPQGDPGQPGTSWPSPGGGIASPGAGLRQR